MSEIGEQERRLVKALASGRIDERLVVEELDALKRHRSILQKRLLSLRPQPASPSPVVHDADLFVRACRAVSDFLDNAGPEDRALALEALQIAIRATPTEAVVHGVVPVDPDMHCHTNNHADARFQMINPGPAFRSE